MKALLFCGLSFFLSGCAAVSALSGPSCGGQIHLSLAYTAEGDDAELSMDGVVVGRGTADLSFLLVGCVEDGCTLRVKGGKHPSALNDVIFAVRSPCPGCARELWLPAVAAVWPDGAETEIETPIAMPSALCDTELTASVRLQK